jgi:DNA helicase-2/ATP-dependent DNA helicase PcrA
LNPILVDLTEAQHKAVTTIDGPLLVIAGAGSGKTRVITKRIAWMVENNIPPEQILAITFTNKAAGEMAERVAKMILGRKPFVSTFHSFCARVLRQKAQYAGLEQNFVIYDTSDARAAIKSCLADLNLDPKSFEPSKIAHCISDAKNKLISPEEMEKNAQTREERHIAQVYARYQAFLRECNASDFDDLLLLVLKIFSQYPEVLQEFQDRYRYLLVDEYQDTNLPQHQLIKLLSAKYGNVCVTGDPDQTIYSWRGADMDNINTFSDEYKNAVVVSLEQNFRSTNNILKAANAVISNNPRRFEKKLFSTLGDGEKIRVHHVSDEVAEAELIANNIKGLQSKGQPLKSIAIFYRTNGQSRVLEDALRLDDLPYTIVGGTKFYDRAEIKDLLAYLRLIENGRDNVSLLRVINTPARGLGPKAVQTIREIAERNHVCLAEALTKDEIRQEISGKALSGIDSFLDIFSSVFELGEKATVADKIKTIYEKSGYKAYLEKGEEEKEDRISNVEALLNAAVDHAEKAGNQNVSSFLENVALIADIDSWADKEERVTMMTLHSAKGLEFDAVFIAGCEENLLPHKNSFENDNAIEEERRLCYVGITRAKKDLFLTHTKSRLQWGNRQFSRKSRFLLEIPETLLVSGNRSSTEGTIRKGFSLIRNWDESTPSAPVIKKIQPTPSHDFDEAPVAITVTQGNMVRHPKFGKGVVMSVMGEGEDSRITVIFEQHGAKVLQGQYANLQKI